MRSGPGNKQLISSLEPIYQHIASQATHGRGYKTTCHPLRRMLKNQQLQSGASGRRHHAFSYKYWITPQASLGPSSGQLQTRRMDRKSLCKSFNCIGQSQKQINLILEILTLSPHFAHKAGFKGHQEQQQIPR